MVQGGFETDREADCLWLKTREKCRTLRKSASADIADVAQSVERVHGKDEVPGSIPGIGSDTIHTAALQKGG